MKSLKCLSRVRWRDDIIATCTFCGKPAEKEVGKKGVRRVCAGEITKMFADELKGKSSKRRNKAGVNLFEKTSWRDLGEEDTDLNSPARWDDYQLDR